MKPLGPPDGYEQKFMGAARAIARERVRMAWWAHVGLALLALWALRATTVWHTVAQLFILAAVWLVCMTLRTVVTPDAVHVQLGFFGPRIPLGSVRAVRAASQSAIRTRGWGIRFDFSGGVTYSVPSAANGYLEITYERNGKLRTVRAMSHEPEKLVLAIERARAAAGMSTQVRIASTATEAEATGPEAASTRSTLSTLPTRTR